jgi:hypothetical protein
MAAEAECLSSFRWAAASGRAADRGAVAVSVVEAAALGDLAAAVVSLAVVEVPRGNNW